MKKVKVPELVLLHSRNSSNTFSIFSMNVYWELTLRTFWEEQLADQFRHFNFSSYLVIFRADQSKKAPCMYVKDMRDILISVEAIWQWLTKSRKHPPMRDSPSLQHGSKSCSCIWELFCALFLAWKHNEYCSQKDHGPKSTITLCKPKLRLVSSF